MSETKDPRRTRRRASRTAGPPVEDATGQLTTDSAAAATVSAAAAESGRDTAEKPGSAAADETAGITAGKSGGAADKSADTANEPAGAAGRAVVASAGQSEGATAGKSTEVSAGGSADVTERIGTAAEPASDAATGTDSVGSGETVRFDKSAVDAGVSDKTGTSAKTAGKPDGDDADNAATVASMEKSGATEPAAQSGSGSWKRIVALTAATVLLIGLVGAAVVSMLVVQSTEQRDERRAEYVATARQTILNLTTIRADTAKEDIDRILTMASGEFKTEFDGRVDPFTEIVKQAQVQSTGEVVEAAVESDDENSAVILVAAKQTLTNAGAEGEQQRHYRFRVTVQRGDDGTLTASDVEFVA